MFFFSKISLTIYNIHQILKSIHFTHTKFSDLYPRFPQWNLLYMLPCWVSLVLWTGFQIETRQTEQNIVISSGKPSKVPRTRCIWVISSVRASSLSFRLRVSPLPSIFCRKNDLIRCFISFMYLFCIFAHFSCIPHPPIVKIQTRVRQVESAWPGRPRRGIAPLASQPIPRLSVMW